MPVDLGVNSDGGLLGGSGSSDGVAKPRSDARMVIRPLSENQVPISLDAGSKLLARSCSFISVLLNGSLFLTASKLGIEGQTRVGTGSGFMVVTAPNVPTATHIGLPEYAM